MLLESFSVLSLCFFVAKDPNDKPAVLVQSIRTFNANILNQANACKWSRVLHVSLKVFI